MSFLYLLSLVNLLPLLPQRKETGVSSTVCHLVRFKWRIWSLRSELCKLRRSPGLVLDEGRAPMAEDEGCPLSLRPPLPGACSQLPLASPAFAPTATSPDCLQSPPPSSCFPSRPAAAFSAFRRPPFLSAKPRPARQLTPCVPPLRARPPRLRPARAQAAPPPRPGREPASEEVMEAEGGGRAAAGKRGGRALGSSPAARPPPRRRPLPRVSSHAASSRRPPRSPRLPPALCPHAGPAAHPHRLDGGAWLTHRPPGLSGGAAGAGPRLLWGAPKWRAPRGTAARLSRSGQNAAKRLGLASKTWLGRLRSCPGEPRLFVAVLPAPCFRRTAWGRWSGPTPRAQSGVNQSGLLRGWFGVFLPFS